jgi:UDP-N-acetylmuramoyl-tripeptide--D-alanyl-D-alanine ligase
MEAAIKTQKSVSTRGRRIAVLGRMGELGDHASAGYQQVGRAAASIDALIAVGSETVPLTETARAGGLKEIHETSSAEEAAAVLRRIAQEGDIILVKGSRAARMERVIENF